MKSLSFFIEATQAKQLGKISSQIIERMGLQKIQICLGKLFKQ